MSTSDILVPISDDQLPLFIEVAKKNHPKGLRAHHFLLSYYRSKKSGYKQIAGDEECFITPRFRFHFYTHPYGNIENCTFIGINEGSIDEVYSYVVFLFSLEPRNKELRECILETKFIKWELNPLFMSVQSENYLLFDEVIKNKNLQISEQLPDTCFYLPKELALSLEIIIPTDVEILPLRISDATTINDVWPFKKKNSEVFIRSQLALFGGLGIFQRESGRLLSWSCKNDNLAVSQIQTLDTEKRKGYGELILRAFCKQFAEEKNLDIIGFVMPTNTASQNLFRKLGFIEFDNGYYFFLTYSGKQKEN